MTLRNEKNLHKNSCSSCSFTPLCVTENNNKSALTNHMMITRTRRLERNETLCMLNSKFQSIYIIKKGAVKAYQVDINGHEHIHAFYFTGETLGYRAIHAGHYISTVVALTETIVCEVPYDYFVESLQTKPESYKYLLALISKQLTASACVDIASAEQRIAAFIIDLSSRTDGAIPMKELVLPMNRQDIGSYLRLTAETVSRILSRMQKNHVIEANGKFIRIANPQKLRQLAQ